VPLKHLVTWNARVLPEDTSPELLIDYIDIGNVQAGRGIVGSESLRFGTAPSRARRILRADDVLVSTVRTYLRAVASVNDEHDGAVCSTGFTVLTAREPQLTASFLSYLEVVP
jgi:type I restriction enzyme S subunit